MFEAARLLGRTARCTQDHQLVARNLEDKRISTVVRGSPAKEIVNNNRCRGSCLAAFAGQVGSKAARPEHRPSRANSRCACWNPRRGPQTKPCNRRELERDAS